MIKYNDDCVGCGACKNICPVNCIVIDRKDGQYAPVINKNMCIGCNACESVCVALKYNQLSFSSTIKAYYGYTKDLTEREKSSSGGVFYAIAREFLCNDGVVVGAAYDETFKVKHIIVKDLNNLSLIRGSKYVESELQSVFPALKKLLDADKKVLFSGVPCQIGAVKTFLGKAYSNLYTCEVFCHGAPRSGIFDAYLSWIKNTFGQIFEFNFRSKYYGWNCPAYEITTDKRKIIEKHKNNVYHLMFGKHVSLRDSCYGCKFRKYERSADLSLGDFWGVENYYPALQTREGVSAILVNTEKGASLVSSPHVNIEPCSLYEIYDKNVWMVKNFEKPLEQRQLVDDFIKMSGDDFFKKYRRKYMITDRVYKIMRRIISCFKN